MLGDFNDWPWRGVVRRTLADALPGRTRLKTYPSWLPMLMLDRIYCRPAEALLRSWTDHRGRRFSDHLPVIGDIAIGIR
jgi:endonuclease/exonuclease/phosphatase family metal-dependent hydrolase